MRRHDETARLCFDPEQKRRIHQEAANRVLDARIERPAVLTAVGIELDEGVDVFPRH